MRIDQSRKQANLRALALECFSIADAYFYSNIEAERAIALCVQRGLAYDDAISFLTTAIAAPKEMH